MYKYNNKVQNRTMTEHDNLKKRHVTQAQSNRSQNTLTIILSREVRNINKIHRVAIYDNNRSYRKGRKDLAFTLDRQTFHRLPLSGRT